MKVLDRYILKVLGVPLVGSLVAFLTVAVLVDGFERVDTFIDHEVPTGTVAQYYVATLPYLFMLILPISVLIAVLFGLGGMARRNELIAITTSGVSLYQVLRPVLAVGVVSSLVALFFSVEVVPRGLDTSGDILEHEMKGRPRVSASTRRDLNYLGNGGRFFLIRDYEGEQGRMARVIVQQFSEGTLVHRIDAELATWKDGGWVFRSGFIRRFDEAGLTGIEPFDERRFPEITETPRDFLRELKEPDAMTLTELREHRRRTELSGGDVTRLRVDEHMRYSFPVASFIIVLLGAPLTGAIRRGGHALGFGLALLVGFVYYVLLQIGETFGYNGTVPPALAAWLANLTFLAIGLISLWKTRK